MKNVLGSISITALCCLTLSLAVGCVLLYSEYNQQAEESQKLQDQLTELTEQEKRSVVMQRINAQMEEIALQERRISDEQREAAEQQTRVAEQMRQHAVEEQQKALHAQHVAQAAEEVANNQRAVAESQRMQAEYSKRVADTLSYQILGRQLGDVAVTQFMAGSKEIAELLTYAAITFTERYKGDIYSPSIYNALTLTCQSKRQWHTHKGGVEDIVFMEGANNRFVTCSTYGELMEHHINGQLKSDTLYMNKDFDFRDVFIDHKRSTIYAVSRTGHLVVHKKGNNTILLVNGIGHLICMENIGHEYVIIGEKGLARLNPSTNQIDKTRSLPFTVTCSSRFENSPLLFDNQGRMHLIHSFDKLESKKTPVTGHVTAFASSQSTGIKAYGMMDGTICLVDAKGKMQRLYGHRSRVSRIKINGWRIYSSGFDGTLNLWMGNKEQIEPMTMLNTNGWLLHFSFDAKKNNIWCGDHKGYLTQGLFSVPMMIERLKGQLKRNLTRDEWNYYIGRNIPYETFMRKEARR